MVTINTYLARFLSYLGGKLALPCLLCQRDTVQSPPLCRACAQSIKPVANPCRCCGLEHSGPSDALCGRCLRNKPPFERCIAIGHYAFPLSYLISQYKYQRRWELRRILADQLYLRLQHSYQEDDWPEAIIAVPLHHSRLRQRGFNQAHQISQIIAKRLNLPRFNKVLRSRATAQQQGLNKAQRRKNMRAAFAIKGNVPYRHVAVIDDVVTSMATGAEISRELHKAGVDRVDLWCLARTPN